MDDSDDSDSSDSGTSWGDWFKNVSSDVIGKYTTSQTDNSYKLKSQQLQQLGTLGYYTEGQATTRAQSQGMNSTILLLGLAVVAVMMLKD